jgi:hypothetical protein
VIYIIDKENKLSTSLKYGVQLGVSDFVSISTNNCYCFVKFT